MSVPQLVGCGSSVYFVATMDESTISYSVNTANSISARPGTMFIRGAFLSASMFFEESWQHTIKEQKKAQNKARKLLESHLTEEQLESYKKKNYIPVDSQFGNKYVIDGNQIAFNIYQIVEEQIVNRFCAQFCDGIPHEDLMLAQLFWLKFHEKAFLKIANYIRYPDI